MVIHYGPMEQIRLRYCIDIEGRPVHAIQDGRSQVMVDGKQKDEG
jgi:hypothetical protein